jgi:hypothetical protein
MIISLRENVLVGCCLDLGDDEELGALGARDEIVQILSFKKGIRWEVCSEKKGGEVAAGKWGGIGLARYRRTAGFEIQPARFHSKSGKISLRPVKGLDCLVEPPCFLPPGPALGGLENLPKIGSRKRRNLACEVLT